MGKQARLANLQLLTVVICSCKLNDSTIVSGGVDSAAAGFCDLVVSYFSGRLTDITQGAGATLLMQLVSPANSVPFAWLDRLPTWPPNCSAAGQSLQSPPPSVAVSPGAAALSPTVTQGLSVSRKDSMTTSTVADSKPHIAHVLTAWSGGFVAPG